MKMINIKKLPGSHLLYLGVSLALWAAYLLLTFAAPINEKTNTFHLSYSELMWLKLTVVVPFFLIWLFGVFAATGIIRYILTIKGAPEEKGFSRVYSGVCILLFGLALGAALGAIRPYLLTSAPDATVTLAVIVRYVNIFVPLVAFGFIFDGATNLARLINKPRNAFADIWPAFFVAAAAVFYAWVTFSNPDRQLGIGPNHSGALYLSDPMIVLTLMIPYVTMWALGIFAAVRMVYYRNGVEGTIYRSALKWIARGILFIVVLSIIFQGLSLLNEFFASAGLQAILIAVYLILAAIAVGYIFLWFGARKLRTIETVI